MRIRRYLIGASVGLVSAFVFSSVASADVTAVTLGGTGVFPAKQDKKVRGPASFTLVSTDTHAGDLPCPLGTGASLSCSAYPPSTRSFFTYSSDYKFTPGNLVDCNLASLAGKSTAQAKAACPRSIIGQGTNTQRFSDGRIINGAITVFNGAPSGGNPSAYLLVDLPGVTSKPILNSVFIGHTADVSIPPVQGSVIDQFNVTFNKVVTGKNKKTGKKTYYFMAKCSKGTWTTTEEVSYSGVRTLSAPPNVQKCKQKKKK